MTLVTRGGVDHLEIRGVDLAAAERSWAWLLTALGYQLRDRWPDGVSWSGPDGSYLVLEAGPDVVATRHDRMRPGLSHLAFHAGSPRDVDDLVGRALEHGWTLLFADHPYAGGPQHYAAYLEYERGSRSSSGRRGPRARRFRGADHVG